MVQGASASSAGGCSTIGRSNWQEKPPGSWGAYLPPGNVAELPRNNMVIWWVLPPPSPLAPRPPLHTRWGSNNTELAVAPRPRGR
eukprot:scaffold129164_cov28-Tisochrysis_lutea.AAC.2